MNIKLKMSKKYIFILLIILLPQNSACFILGIFNAARVAWKTMVFLNNIAFSIDTGMKIEQFLINGENGFEILSNQLVEIQKELKEFRGYTTYKLNMFEKLISELPDEIDIRRKKGDIVSFISKIDDQYDEFIRHTKNNGSAEIFNDFTFTFLAASKKSLCHFRSILIPHIKFRSFETGLFNSLAAGAANKQDRQCGDGQTIQYHLIDLFQMVMVTEVKVQIMLSFSYRWRYTVNDGWKLEIEALKQDFADHTMRYVYELLYALRTVRFSYLRNCDPENGVWIRDRSFYEIDGLLQQAIFKFWLGPYNRRARCAPQSRKEHLSPWYWLGKNICTGSVTSCRPLGSVQACVLEPGNAHKYKWVMIGRPSTWPKNYETCPTNNVDSVRRNSFYDWMSCACQCSNIRYAVYLTPVESRVESNYVITGLRFLRSQGLLYLQPAEGKLEAHGYIASSSWIPVRYETERDIRYVTLDRNVFFLNDLQLPPGYALTGVKFNIANRGDGNEIQGFAIGIIGVPFDYETGRLDLMPENKLMYNAPSSYPEVELPLKPVNPINMNPYEPQVPSSKKYTYVKLQQTAFEDDFGQTILPFFDAVQIELDPPSPLGGIGIFHKGFEGRAGFISLRIYSIDYLDSLTSFINKYENNATAIWDF